MQAITSQKLVLMVENDLTNKDENKYLSKIYINDKVSSNKKDNRYSHDLNELLKKLFDDRL